MRSNKGFSLLEILVAFSLMGIALGIMLNIFSSGVNSAALSEEYIVATQLAESLMATTGVEKPLLVGDEEGVEADKYRWRISVEPHPDLSQELAQVELLLVEVEVEWGDESDVRSVVLDTVKTGQIRQ